MTIWKDVVGYENLYEVSDSGLVRSKDRILFLPQNGGNITKKGRILKPNKVAFDYFQVTLYDDKKRRSRYVHNLVMEAFVGEKLLGYEVNHKDEDKSNNALSNLEYITAIENNNYGTRVKRMVEANTNGKRSKSIRGTHILTGEIVEFPSMSEAKRQGYGTHISDVVNGKRNHAKGYRWSLIE